jgi:altronate dehydratase
MSTAIQILEADSVATAVKTLEAGDPVRISGVQQGQSIVAQEEIPRGHKIAVRDIEEDEYIIKYGEVIGAATQTIPAGHWVHVHNCRGVKARRFEE